MMNWKDYLNSSKSSANHIIKTIFFVLIFFVTVYSQNGYTEDEKTITDSVYTPTKSPWTAVLMSAVIPGAGQVYNGSYLKAPLIWGLTGWLVYNWIQNNKYYKENSDLYLNTGLIGYKDKRSFYRDQRDLFTIYFGLTYMLNLVDAYVDAELFDFSVDEDFLIHQPRLNIRFNLR